MQIKPNVVQVPVNPTDVVGQRLPAKGKPDFQVREEEGVVLSQQASWVAALKSEAKSVPTVRQDVVEQTRAELQSGSLNTLYKGSAVNALLAEFSS